MTTSYDGGTVISAAISKPEVDLPKPYSDMFDRVFRVWSGKLGRNMIRQRYYDGHNVLKNFGIAIPPQLENVETVVGWPAKAVDALAVRSRFSGFRADGDTAALLDKIVNKNRLVDTYNQLVPSELISSPAFLTLWRGADGTAVIRAHDATTAAGVWDYENNRLAYGITVAALDSYGRPSAFNLYAPGAMVIINKAGDRWTHSVQPFPMDVPLMVPLIYKPTLTRPFGKSRISRAVMSITDSAVRTALRTEVSAEFFTSPQKYLLGAPDNIFGGGEDDDADDYDDDEAAGEGVDDDEDAGEAYKAVSTRWETYLGAIFAITRDEDGNLPEFGQLPAVSMEPHIGYMRSLAARFSGETNVPISELGIIQDNPSSAEAIYASKEALIIDAEKLNESNGEALRQVAQMAIAITKNEPLNALTDEETAVTAYFMNPARPSLVAQADAMTKQASVTPAIVYTRTYWEELGYSDGQIDELLAELKKNQGISLLGLLSGSNAAGVNPQNSLGTYGQLG